MQRTVPDASARGGAGRAVLSGFCASLVAVGLGRFAYTPLIPALIAAGWFAPAAAAYLAAGNLAGYLAGALAARPLARRLPAAPLLRGMMALSAASFLACAWHAGFAWFLLWRFIAGVAGAVLMIVAASLVLPHVPPARRGRASGFIFLGIGAGIALSGTLLPLLLRGGLPLTWVALGVLGCALTALAWGGWPGGAPATPPTAPPRHAGRRIAALYASYGLTAAGLVPHFVFLADFVARGLGRGVAAGAWVWVLFGLGAAAGPVLAGIAADRIGFAVALRLLWALAAAGIGVLALTSAPAAVAASALVVGACGPASTALVLGRVHELLPGRTAAQAGAWARATIAFALLQAVAAYALSFVFARTGDYAVLFAAGGAALLLALAIDLSGNRRGSGPAAPAHTK
jgi:predicted MFS family arabinose efflux permease